MLAPWVIENMPDHKRYVEPYCGAASVLLRKPPCKVEVLNDKYQRLINVFQILRNPNKAQELKRLLAYTPYSKDEFYAAYEESDDPIEDARRMFVLSYQGVGSRICARPARKGGWNRDVSKNIKHDSTSRWIDFSSYIDQWCERLHGVRIEHDDALPIIDHYDHSETLFFVDPPYVKSSRKDTARIYEHEMTDEEHRELAVKLHNASGMIIVNGYPSELYKELYQDWQMLIKESLNQSGQKTTEVLWLSPSITNHRDPVDEVISRLFIEKT